jgi:hypothetical protein
MRKALNWITGLAAGAMLLSACGSNLPDPAGASTAGNSGSGGSGGSGAAGNWTPTAPSSSICSGKGPIVIIPATTVSGSYQTCTGSIAESHFSNALCTCKDANVAGYLRSRAFDSKKGTSVDLGGSVGINQTYVTAGFTDVGGAFSIAGSQSLAFAGYLKTGGDLRVEGKTMVPGYTEVGRDLWVADGYTDVGPLTVHRDLHGTGAVMAIPLMVQGKKIPDAVTVAPPCPCEDKDIIDVDGLVTEAKTDNDDAKDGIDPSMLSVLIGDVEVTLPCGKIYFEQIGGIGNVIFNVTGRVAVFVGGSVANTGNLEFRLSPGAEIDLFISGDLAVTGRAVFGQKDRPAASRIYVGGSGDVFLTGFTEFVGNLYAPRSLVQGIGFENVYGSIFAGNFVSPGFANFVYDAAIMSVGDNCGAPPPPPNTCNQCGTCTGGTACVNGTCGACRSDADCCGQLICSNGACVEQGVIY